MDWEGGLRSLQLIGHAVLVLAVLLLESEWLLGAVGCEVGIDLLLRLVAHLICLVVFKLVDSVGIDVGLERCSGWLGWRHGLTVLLESSWSSSSSTSTAMGLPTTSTSSLPLIMAIPPTSLI